MRNKSYDINSRKLFANDSNNSNQLDQCGQLFSQLIVHSENLLLAYNKLNVSANELKKIYENLSISESLIDKNVWDRELRPGFEQSNFVNTQNSIEKVFCHFFNVSNENDFK